MIFFQLYIFFAVQYPGQITQEGPIIQLMIGPSSENKFDCYNKSVAVRRRKQEANPYLKINPSLNGSSGSK